MHAADLVSVISAVQVADGSGPWEHCTLSAEVYNMTHCAVRSRDVHCVLIKAKWGGHWPHLLRDNEKPKNMQIDWSKVCPSPHLSFPFAWVAWFVCLRLCSCG